MHSYIRFKLALTEERPTIKPYDETRWSALGYYAWHCRHHIGQIVWLREQRGWRRPL